MLEKYISSGDGYWHNSEDPSQGCAGIPPEVDEERERLWRGKSFLDDKYKIRVIKAMKLIREHGSRDIHYKIKILERLGYNNIRVKGKTISLSEAERYPRNLSRMYDRSITGIREIIRNPEGESKLAERLDSLDINFR